MPTQQECQPKAALAEVPTANVRSGPGTQYRIVGKAEYGEVVRTRENRRRWVRVEREGATNGWIAKSLLWGW